MTTDSDEPSYDERHRERIFLLVMGMVEARRDEQLRQYEKAGLPPNRQQALREAIAQQRETLIQWAERDAGTCERKSVLR